jgi:hypothetical protein
MRAAERGVQHVCTINDSNLSPERVAPLIMECCGRSIFFKKEESRNIFVSILYHGNHICYIRYVSQRVLLHIFHLHKSIEWARPCKLIM